MSATVIPMMLVTLLVGATPASAWALPSSITPLLPSHYKVIASAEVRPTPSSRFYIVALARGDEAGPFDEAHATARRSSSSSLPALGRTWWLETTTSC